MGLFALMLPVPFQPKGGGVQRKAEDLCVQLSGVRDRGLCSGTGRAACGQQGQLLGGGCASLGPDLRRCGVHPGVQPSVGGQDPYGAQQT